MYYMHACSYFSSVYRVLFRRLTSTRTTMAAVTASTTSTPTMQNAATAHTCTGSVWQRQEQAVIGRTTQSHVDCMHVYVRV